MGTPYEVLSVHLDLIEYSPNHATSRNNRVSARSSFFMDILFMYSYSYRWVACL